MNVNALAGARPLQVRPGDPDAELVAAARTNPREFLALYDRYFDRVLGYVRLRIRDPATCEDVTSRVFTTALEQIGRLRGDGSFGGRVFQIARKIDLPQGLVAYFDTVTYKPRYLDDPQRDGSVVRLRVAAYDYLAMTPENRALLSITAQHPRAQIVIGGGGTAAGK